MVVIEFSARVDHQRPAPGAGRAAEFAGGVALASLREPEYAALASCATGMHAVCPRYARFFARRGTLAERPGRPAPAGAGRRRSRYIREGLGLCAHSARRTVTSRGSGMSSTLQTWYLAAWPATWPCC